MPLPLWGWIAIGAGGLGALALLGGKPNVITAYPVDLGGGTTNAAPPTPMQGDGFRIGPQPDPVAPDDPNRGRNFVVMEQSRQSGSVAQGSIVLANLPSDARGRMEVKVWATRAGKPHRCSRWFGSANVVDGRIVGAGTWQVPTPAICGTQHATATDAGGCTLKMPHVQWEQQGPTMTLLWRTEVNTGNQWSDQDCDEDLEFYVDVFWRWIPD